MDAYKELGVNKNSTQDEIKKAYKRLAMKHHPDRGGDASKLSKINEAYNILKTPEKRKEYDNPSVGQPGFGGHGGFGGFGGFGGNHPDMGAVFEEIFMDANGFTTRRRSVKRNQTLRMTTVLSLKDCYVGKQFSASVQLPSGEVEEIEVGIPKGVTNGDVVKISGKGDNSHKDIPRGDILVEVHVRPENGWDLHGYDILTTKELSVFDLMTGTSVDVLTPNNKKLKLTIPPGSQVGSVLSINGMGLPKPKTTNNGNIMVKLNSFIPKVESDNIIAKIKEIENAIVEASK